MDVNLTCSKSQWRALLIQCYLVLHLTFVVQHLQFLKPAWDIIGLWFKNIYETKNHNKINYEINSHIPFQTLWDVSYIPSFFLSFPVFPTYHVLQSQLINVFTTSLKDSVGLNHHSLLQPHMYCIVLHCCRNGINYNRIIWTCKQLEFICNYFCSTKQKLGKALNAKKQAFLRSLRSPGCHINRKLETNLSPSFMLSWSSTQNRCEHAYTALHWSGFFKSFAEYCPMKRHQKWGFSRKIYIKHCVNDRNQ